jgi:hypothetical protein
MHENQGHILLHGLLVHIVEVEAGVVVLDGLEAVFVSTAGNPSSVACRAHHFGSICSGGMSCLGVVGEQKGRRQQRQMR